MPKIKATYHIIWGSVFEFISNLLALIYHITEEIRLNNI
jgi:hypothetical protein